MATLNSNNILQLVEGVLFNNNIIPLTDKTKKDLYQEVVSEILKSWSGASSININTLATMVDQWNSNYEKIIKGEYTGLITADSLYQQWEKINALIMRNSSIAIIATARKEINGLDRTGAYAANEGDFLKQGVTKASNITIKDKNGKTVGTKKEFRTGISRDILDPDIKDNRISRFNFGKHYENLENTMTKKVPSDDEFIAALPFISDPKGRDANWYKRCNRYWAGRTHKNIVFNNLVYGDKYSDNIGRIVEVFFNHLVMYHHGQITVNTDGDLDISRSTNQTVRSEEYPNLLYHMYQWNDNDPLTAGGDIIVIDKINKTFYNIQLKSTTQALGKLPTTIGNYVNITTIYNKYMKYAPKVLKAIQEGTNFIEKNNGRKYKIIPEAFVYNLITSVWTNPK